MKGLKIFGWICLGLTLVCLLMPQIEAFWNDEIHWQLSALIFFLAAILSWLVSRALKEIKNDLDLKMLMSK